MRTNVEIVTCDLCGRRRDCIIIRYPVVFETDQTEGKSCEPYVSYTELDVCPECRRRVLMVRATVAMGCNEYRVVEL